MQPCELSASAIARGVRSGKLTAVDVVRSHIERIDDHDSEISAFASTDHSRAIKRARAIDEGKVAAGILAGVPFAIKDIIDSRDFPVTLGSRIYTDRKPIRNAACLDLCLAAGGIPLGMSISTEFACFTPGPTRNPHNIEHTPGGSSSGSAAAVADHMAAFGFGSQTAASLIRPAAYCGTYAYKSSQGSIDLEGVMSLAPSLDSLGVLTRSAQDLELLRVVLQPGICPSGSFANGGPRIGLFRGPNWSWCTKAGQNACLNIVNDLADCGSVVEDLDCPSLFNGLNDAHATVMGYELVRTRSTGYRDHRDDLSPQFLGMYENSLDISFGEYRSALRLRDECITILDELFTDTDVIITPAAAGEAPHGLNSTGDPLFSRMWTLLRSPAVARPYGTGPRGLPLAVQLIGGSGQDSGLLSAACWIDRHLS